ncbi:MAG: hypothetical protein QN141_12400 [Armatimonadota bacterium]|nr:hypothetical protein [Armatimonadota bacterium]MDR7452748.1 hypothetical protein [Armatimonadota bacterium]MDR7468290.1 hypothetical protein [Armatimonadota bacterium]MDR7495025.1 hypothetical protein [Armatimonadota bacterium]MDR7500461.1 hypothetical protein [Armatimonadota bacterium]
MKRTLAALALVALLAPAAFAAEVGFSDIERPVDATANQLHKQNQDGAGLAGSRSVTEEDQPVEIFMLEGL